MNRREILVALIVIVLALVTYRTYRLEKTSSSSSIQVALAYDPQETSESGIRAAYDAYLHEQGVPHQWISNRDLMLLDGRQSAHHYPAIIFVERVNRFVPSQLVSVMSDYLQAGGNVAVISDAGTRNRRNFYLREGSFSELAGVDYLLARKGGAPQFFNGSVQFLNATAARRWRVPPGKLNGDVLATYGYGTSIFPLYAARSRGADVDATSNSNAVLTRRAIGPGTIVYINVPLGLMRANVTSFPMHAFLSAFLYSVAHVPRLVPAPDGVGQLIVNLHIDSSIEFRGIPNMQRRHLLRRDLPMEFDVTAGPDRDKTGDGLGFDACGKGRRYLKILQGFGTIGSHGGWTHNEFAYAVEAGKLTQAQMQALIRKNNECLSSQTHGAIRGYAAPAGAHPQPAMTNALDALGMAGYYYAGDSGAPAERAFAHGKMVSERAWAFPVIADGPRASLGEMRLAKVRPERVSKWLNDAVYYTARDRSIHLIYSHSYDLLYKPYDAPFASFLDKLAKVKKNNIVLTTTIDGAVDFMTRFMSTSYEFTREKHAIIVTANNPMGLKHLAFSIPKAGLASFHTPEGLTDRGSDQTFRYFSVSTRTNHIRYSFPTVNQ